MLDETRQSIYEKQVKLASLLLYQNMLAQEVWETYDRLLQCLANYALDGHENNSRRLVIYLPMANGFGRSLRQATTGAIM